MKAMVIDTFGGPETFRVARIDRPRAAPGNVVVQLAWAAVNPADWKAREGWLSRYFDYLFPFVLGFDGSGIVVEVGEGVERLSVGDRVVTPGNQGTGENGSYAEYLHALAERVVKVPDHVSLRDAVTLPTAGMTAWLAVFDEGCAKEGSLVFVNGGAGGTGSFAVQLARMVGARVIATCSAGNADYVRALGAEATIDYRIEDVMEVLDRFAPQGLDLVVDTVGQGTILGVVDRVRRGGAVAPIATLIENEPSYDLARSDAAGVAIRPAASTHDRQPQHLRGLMDALSAGRIGAPEITQLPLDEVADAHRSIEAGHVRGKIVLAIDPAIDKFDQ